MFGRPFCNLLGDIGCVSAFFVFCVVFQVTSAAHSSASGVIHYLLSVSRPSVKLVRLFPQTFNPFHELERVLGVRARLVAGVRMHDWQQVFRQLHGFVAKVVKVIGQKCFFSTPIDNAIALVMHA